MHPPPHNKPSVSFDPETYAHHIAELDLTPDQRDELILAIANIMIAFVDLGFGIAPGQTACGQLDVLSDLLPEAAPDLLYCEHIKTHEKQAIAKIFADAELEES